MCMALQKHLGFAPATNHRELGQRAQTVSGTLFKDAKVGLE